MTKNKQTKSPFAAILANTKGSSRIANAVAPRIKEKLDGADEAEQNMRVVNKMLETATTQTQKGDTEITEDEHITQLKAQIGHLERGLREHAEITGVALAGLIALERVVQGTLRRLPAGLVNECRNAAGEIDRAFTQDTEEGEKS